jgi:predicted AlkP superfamily pyrophosphatase or phosphodiesterase
MSYKIESDDLSKISNISIPNVKIVSAVKNDHLHYHNSMYDFLLLANEGWMLYSNKDIEKYGGKLPVKGMHGYDSESMNMHAIFYAYGPKFKSGFKIDTFELIHVYPMLCKLLEINPYDDINGKLSVLNPILK